MEYVTTNQDRREGRRLPTRDDLSLKMNGNQAQIINLSQGGIRFVVKGSKRVEDMFLELRGNGRKQLLLAKTVWNRDVEQGHQMLGVRITKAFPDSPV